MFLQILVYGCNIIEDDFLFRLRKANTPFVSKFLQGGFTLDIQSLHGLFLGYPLADCMIEFFVKIAVDFVQEVIKGVFLYANYIHAE